MRGGFFRVLGQCFAGNFGAVARRTWAVLPRNFGVFGLNEDATGRFSARQIWAGARGEKIFKKFLKTCEKPKNWGVGGGAGVAYIGCAGRILGLESFEPGS